MTAQLIKDLSNKDYHAHKATSRSALMELNKSPKKYHHKFISEDYEHKETDALRLGSAFHTLVLEPEDFAEHCAIHPEGKKRPTKPQLNAKEKTDSTALLIKFWEKFDDENDGKTIIKQDEVDKLTAMAKSLRSEPAAQKILGQKGLIEPSIFWTDKETGIDMKCKLDFVPLNYSILVDLKTTASVDRNKFEKSIADFGYDLQAFIATEAIFQLTGTRPEMFVFAAVEKEPPYDTGFFMADSIVLKRGELLYRHLLNKLAGCRVKDEWPSQGGGKVQAVSLSPWVINKMDELKGEE
ncbi:MAG: hypothetical protein COB09_19050 [Thalassobium sp.]|nr:MAG: hypothetical protein COB09_19050 [Thalassobium sp.]